MNKKDLPEADIKAKFITPAELIKAFGSKQKYLKALKELEKELYKIA